MYIYHQKTSKASQQVKHDKNCWTEISITVNEAEYKCKVRNEITLLEFLRETLSLTGTKRGCDSGHCGACTVLMNGRAVNSCMTLAIQCDGATVTTVEGLASGEKLHPLQEAFIDANAIQCGFCTPGMLLSAKSLLDRNLNPTDQEIREALSGNLCRCTGYTKIINAVRDAGVRMREELS